MRTKFILWIICVFVWAGCTKNSPIEEVDSGTVEEVKPDPEPVPQFEKRNVQIEMNEYYADSSIDQQYFLGSIWHLQDTIEGLQLESLTKKTKAEKFHILSHNFSVEMGFAELNYNSVLAHANKFKESTQSGMINMSKTTFADYAEIQGYLGYSKDVDQVLTLVRHSDSTTIQKKYNTLLYSNIDRFTLFIDHIEYYDAYPESTISEFKKDGYNPYVLASATYGSQLIIMAESDSLRSSLNTVIEKLLAEAQLDQQDIAVLDGSQVLIYYRDGGKNSFVKYPKGSVSIGSAVAELLIRIKQTENTFNYPLKYSFMSMEDYRTLRTYTMYETHIRK